MTLKTLQTQLDALRYAEQSALLTAYSLLPVGTMVYFKWQGRQTKPSTGVVLGYTWDNGTLRVSIDHAQTKERSRYPRKVVAASREWFELNGVTR